MPEKSPDEIRETAEDCVSSATRLEPDAPDWRRAVDACVAAYLAGRLEQRAEVERLRSGLRDARAHILAGRACEALRAIDRALAEGRDAP